MDNHERPARCMNAGNMKENVDGPAERIDKINSLIAEINNRVDALGGTLSFFMYEEVSHQDEGVKDPTTPEPVITDRAMSQLVRNLGGIICALDATASKIAYVTRRIDS